MKKGLLTMAAFGALGAGGLMVGSASAAISDDFRASLAEKLGVSQEQVDEAVSEIREEKKVEKQQERQEYLEGQVEAGAITQDQLDALNAFKAELQAEREEAYVQDLSREERKEMRADMKARFEAFADEQGIDLEALRPEGSGDKRGGRSLRGGADRQAEIESQVEAQLQST